MFPLIRSTCTSCAVCLIWVIDIDGPSPYIYDLYLFFQWTTVWKNWLKKLRTIALPVYFMVLNFDYGSQLSIINVSKYCLMPVTFYPLVVILRGGG